MQEVRAAMMAAGFGEAAVNNPDLIRAFMAKASKNTAAANHLSGVVTKTTGLVDAFSGEAALAFDSTILSTTLTAFGSEDADKKNKANEKFDESFLGGVFSFKPLLEMNRNIVKRSYLRRGHSMASLLYDPGTDATHIDQEDAEERLLALGELLDTAGGSKDLLAIVNGLKTTGGSIEDAIESMLVSTDTTEDQRKILGKLQGSKHLGPLKQLLKVKGLRVGDLTKAGTMAKGFKQHSALSNVIESLKDTGFNNILGDEATKASRVIENLKSTDKAAEALQAYDKSHDVDRALTTFGLNLNKMDDSQKEQVRRLFMDTVGAEGKSGIGDFQKQLFKILDSAGKTSGGKSGGKTAEDPTLNTIRSFDKMLEASAMMMVALTKDKEAGAADLKRAQSILQELASRAQVN
jgi:hypothetical protein